MLSFFLLINFLLATLSLETIDAQRENNPLKVLVHLGLGTRSHIKGMLEATQVLSSRGHSITFATFDDHLRFSNGYSMTNYSLGPPPFDKDQVRKDHLKRINGGKNLKDLSTLLDLMIKPMTLYYDKTYPLLDKFVKESEFDLIVCDFCSPACIDIAEKQGVPLIIGVQTSDAPNLVHAPYITNSFEYGPLTIESLSFLERFYQSILFPAKALLKMWPTISTMNNNRINMGLLPSNSIFSHLSYGLILSNSFVGFESAVPMAPNVFHVGPITTANRPVLEEDLSLFYQTHEKVVYVAFGSFVMLSNAEITKILGSVILALESKAIDGVLWGLGSTLLEDFPANIQVNDITFDTSDILNNSHPDIKLLRWAPQETILHHERTKLFISHCGLESAFEAITSRNPVLCIPFLGDQPRNAKKLEVMGIGKYIDKEVATLQDIVNAVKHLITDPNNTIQPNLDRMNIISQYSSKRVHLAADLMEQHVYTSKACRPTQSYDPQSGKPPCELKHLVDVGKDISFIKKNLLDVYFVAISTVLLTLIFAFYIVYKIMSLVYSKVSNLHIPKMKQN